MSTTIKLPRVKKGEIVTADVFNAMAEAIEAGQVIVPASSGLNVIETPQGRILSAVRQRIKSGGGANDPHPFKVLTAGYSGGIPQVKVTRGVVIDTVDPFPDFESLTVAVAGAVASMASALVSAAGGSGGSVDLSSLESLATDLLDLEKENFRYVKPYIGDFLLDDPSDGDSDDLHVPYLSVEDSGNVWLKVVANGTFDTTVNPDELELIYRVEDEDPENSDEETYVKIAKITVTINDDGDKIISSIEQYVSDAVYNPLRPDDILDMIARMVSELIALLAGLATAAISALGVLAAELAALAAELAALAAAVAAAQATADAALAAAAAALAAAEAAMAAVEALAASLVDCTLAVKFATTTTGNLVVAAACGTGNPKVTVATTGITATDGTNNSILTPTAFSIADSSGNLLSESKTTLTIQDASGNSLVANKSGATVTNSAGDSMQLTANHFEQDAAGGDKTKINPNYIELDSGANQLNADATIINLFDATKSMNLSKDGIAFDNGSVTITISISGASGHDIAFREVDICVDGTAMKMMVLGSEPY